MNLGTAAAKAPLQKQKVAGMFPRKTKQQTTPPALQPMAQENMPQDKEKKHWTQAAVLRKKK